MKLSDESQVKLTCKRRTLLLFLDEGRFITRRENDAVKALKCLKEKYEGKGLIAKLMAINKYRKISVGTSVPEYIEALRTSYKQLSSLGLTIPEILKVSDLMLNVPEEMSNINSHLFNVDEKDLKFETVAQSVAIECQRKELSKLTTGDTSQAMKAERNPHIKNQKLPLNHEARRRMKWCPQCRRKGHDLNNCRYAKRNSNYVIEHSNTINPDDAASTFALIESDAFFTKKVMKLISPLPSTPKIFKQVESLTKSKLPLGNRSPIRPGTTKTIDDIVKTIVKKRTPNRLPQCKVTRPFIPPSPRSDASSRKKTIP